MDRRIVPHDIELEGALMGSLLAVPSLIGEAVSILIPSDFHDPLYKAAFGEMVNRYTKGQAIDLHTVAVAVDTEVTGVDAREALLRTFDSETVPTKGTVKEYCRLVSEMARKRHLIQVAGEIAEIGYDDTPAEEAEARALSLALDASRHREIGTYRPLGRVMDTAGEAIIAGIENPQTLLGLDSGLVAVNRILGGLQATNLIVIAGRPSMGKSSLASTLALNVAKAGHKVAINSLEMGEKRLTLRFVSSLSAVRAEKIRRGEITAEEKTRVYDCLSELRALPIYLDCRVNLTSTQIAAKARELVGSKALELLIVDYLGLLADSDDSEVRRLGQITRTLKAVAVDLNVPVIALHQLSRHLTQRKDKVPVLSDLRGSGRIEEDADIVLFIHRDDYYKPNVQEDDVSMCDLVVAKNRDGRTGRFKLAFDRATLTFRDVEERYEQGNI